ncbi:MAG: putative pyruvate synthase, gamma subunit [Deltaproteobacteria bacterium]|nr:putative pyruvate synthase, gamma subunit [Deltaproteobacteria bacterium]
MYRIRFHGRGGQGLKTASRILGTAFFLEGFEVQDAPRYGAERRGAPIFAYVRADRRAVQERGVIHDPDLVVVADETLVAFSAASVLEGVGARTVLLIHGREEAEVWRNRLRLSGPVFILPSIREDGHCLEQRYIGTACAAAAACLSGVVSRASLENAIRDELADLPDESMEKSREHARWAYDRMDPHRGSVTPGTAVPVERCPRPGWVDLTFEDACVSAPAIHAGVTSGLVRTGLWRTMRPVIDRARCKCCWWVCGTLCPDGVIQVDDADRPRIDYDHCKGCMVCLAQCPNRAIEAIPEPDARISEIAGGSR